MRRVLALALVLAGGCNAIFGLDAPSLRADGAVGDDAGGDAAVDAAACLSPAGHDEDGDGVDDACDSCPHIATPDGDLDSDHDGVGDACDPRPGLRDQILAFAPLAGEPLLWTPVRGTWLYDPEGLHQADTASATDALAMFNPTYFGDVIFEVGVRIDGTTTTPWQSFAVWFDAAATGPTTQPDGYQVAVRNTGGTPNVDVSTWDGQIQNVMSSAVITGGAYAGGARYRVQARREDTLSLGTATHVQTGATGAADGTDSTYTSGQLGLATLGTAITVEYVVVYVAGN